MTIRKIKKQALSEATGRKEANVKAQYAQCGDLGMLGERWKK
jgi:hypothetical protein